MALQMVDSFAMLAVAKQAWSFPAPHRSSLVLALCRELPLWLPLLVLGQVAVSRLLHVGMRVSPVSASSFLIFLYRMAVDDLTPYYSTRLLVADTNLEE